MLLDVVDVADGANRTRRCQQCDSDTTDIAVDYFGSECNETCRHNGRVSPLLTCLTRPLNKHRFLISRKRPVAVDPHFQKKN